MGALESLLATASGIAVSVLGALCESSRAAFASNAAVSSVCPVGGASTFAVAIASGADPSADAAESSVVSLSGSNSADVTGFESAVVLSFLDVCSEAVSGEPVPRVWPVADPALSLTSAAGVESPEACAASPAVGAWVASGDSADPAVACVSPAAFAASSGGEGGLPPFLTTSAATIESASTTSARAE